MMPIKKIGWQGATRARHLRQHLEFGLTRWQQGWFREPQLAARILAFEEDEAPALDDLQWWTLDHEGACLYFGTTSDIEVRLGADVLGIAPTSKSALVPNVGSRCFSELCSSLWGGADGAELMPSDRPAQNVAEERYGSVICGVEGLPVMLWVIAARSWCDRFGPDWPEQSVVLTDRHAALKGTSVTVSAHIELGTIPLADSVGWAVGEVLVTDASRRSPVALGVAGKLVCTGTLTSSQGIRAVTVN